MKLLKNKIIFVVSLILATVFVVLSVIGFLWNSLTTQSDLPVDGVVTVSFDGSVRYVTTDGEKLLSLSEDGEILWQTDISDRVKDVAVTEEFIILSYSSVRTIDVFGKEGEKKKSIELPYVVDGIAAVRNTLYVAVTRSTLSGSSIYCFENFPEDDRYDAVAFTNAIVDLALSPDQTLYVVARDYTIYTVTRTGGELSHAEYAVVPYEPLAIGFTGDNVAVADKNGTVYVFYAGGNTARISSGMTFCAFAVSGKYAVGANISGTAVFFDLDEGKIVAKLSSPTEVTHIALSPDGEIYLSEYRTFRTAHQSFHALKWASFFAVSRWIFMVLAVACVVVTVIFSQRLSEKREARYQLFAVHFSVRFRQYFKSYMFLLPTFVMLVMFMYVPTVWSLFLSFFDYTPGVYTRFVGFENFVAALSDPFFIGSVGNMLLFLVTDILKALIPAILIAECIFSLNSMRAQYWIRVLLYVPAVLPGVAVLLIWTKGVYGDAGLLNSILALFGVEPLDWMGNAKTSMLSLILIGFPWAGQYILFYGALMSVPDSLKESARLDGCNWLQGIWYVDLPMIAPQIKYVFIITFINSIQDFGRIYLTTGQTEATNIPVLQMYMILNSGNSYGKAAAMGVLLFFVVFAATYFNFRMQRAEKESAI